MITVQAIANTLEKIPTDGSSWLIPNWRYTYREIKINLIFALTYNTRWEKLSEFILYEDIDKIIEWKDNTPTWKTIIENNDVAMFPKQLKKLACYFILNVDKECCQHINQMSYLAVNDTLHADYFHKRLNEFKEEYGVFRLRCVIGDNLYKTLRRHLKVTDTEFIEVYGLLLYKDIDACDELLIEMLSKGHLTGGVRNYKIEKDYACFF